jgi:hypothetical protein
VIGWTTMQACAAASILGERQKLKQLENQLAAVG